MDKKAIVEELVGCAESFPYWLFKYARIVDPPTQTNVGGIVPFQNWPNIRVSIDAFEKHQHIVIIKSRQIGESYIVAAWCLWNALFHDGDTSLLFSRGETEAIELLGKAKRMYDQLPKWMQWKLNPDSRTELGWPERHSTTKAFAATEAAGVSFTASRVVNDEWPYHPFAGANYMSAKPTIDAGGQFIGLGTVDKLHPDNLATGIFEDAYNHMQRLDPVCQEVKNMIYPIGPSPNGFVPVFFPYWVRPGRDEEWYERTKASIPERELQGLTRDLYMEQAYPRSVDEALRATQTVAAVDLKVLDEMKKRCTASVTVEGLDPLVCHVWQPFTVGEIYLSGTDTSHGVGKDYSVTAIMNARTGVIVADIMTNKMEPDEFAWYSVQLEKAYHYPKWWPEDNDNGATVIDCARKLDYPNFGYQDDKRTKPGWHMGNTNRTRFFDNLVAAFNTWQVQILNHKGLCQFGDLIRNVEQNGRIEARKGGNDDYPVAVGICVEKRAEVLKNVNWNVKPIQTLHFRPTGRKVLARR